MPASGERRQFFLKSSRVAVAAIALPDLFRSRLSQAGAAQADVETAPHRSAKQAIVILLQGGCSQLDSWDPKPDAPAVIRGEFQPIASSVPGLWVCEHLPLLAQRARRFNVLRSVHHTAYLHEEGIHWVLTGYDYPGAMTTSKNRNDKPAMGSVVARVLGPGKSGLPPYVCVPDKGQLGDRVRYASAHFLGVAYDPIESGMPPSDCESPFRLPPNLSLSKGVDLDRFDHRRRLLRQLDRLPQALESTGMMDDWGGLSRHAFEMLSRNATSDAFDLTREPVALRRRYGNTRVGQEAILARRLAEAGVPFTLVNFSLDQDWDTHRNNFTTLKNKRLPQFDRAVSALLDDLEERGLLETTLVAVITEFGRTPRINADVGRDHWPAVFSVVVAGGGLKSGHVIGSSNSLGELPQDRPMHINDVLATIYHQLGVSPHLVHHDDLGRAIPVLYHGEPIRELI